MRSTPNKQLKKSEKKEMTLRKDGRKNKDKKKERKK